MTEAEMTERDMMALSASEWACYAYPNDDEISRAQRAAFIAGAIWTLKRHADGEEGLSDD